MTYQELLDILVNPENSKVEFKLDTERPERLAKEIVAFANFRGGQIFVGIDDKTRDIRGLTRENFEEYLMDTIFGRYITPSIIPIYEELQTEKGKVAVITVEQGTLKPYFVKEGDRETPYIRIGSTSRIADRDQILRMAQESGNYHFEISPVSGSSWTDIDLELFVEFYKNNFEEKREQLNEEYLKEQAGNLDLLKSSSSGVLMCTIAGLVLFGKNPARYLPQYGIRIIHFKDFEPDTDISFDQMFTNCIARITDKDQVVRSGLVDMVILKIGEVLSEEKIMSDNITRKKLWKIPERVLRELVVNSIIHRDYTKNGKNEIRIYRDRLEIESQGRLPNTLTIEKIKSGQKYPRNPILVQFAQDLGLMEHKGLGIRKIVLDRLQKDGFREPELVETDDSFTVRIFFKQ